MNRPLVSIGIVSWNSAEVIETCLKAVRALAWPAVELRVLDNASDDDTWTRLERATTSEERIRSSVNLGFSAAHNRLIDATHGDYYLALNPDVELSPAFLDALVGACEARPTAGSASGKLLRFTPPDVIDSTGIVMLPSQRHLDRGADQADLGQFERAALVFGASGAAALYRRTMLDDTKVGREYFDEDFFAYREDADLAWRAQLMGWECLYVPTARARHGRRVTPERRGGLSPLINCYSVRNRFLLRLKNQTCRHAVRFLVPGLIRDAQVIGYVLVREWSSLPGLWDVCRLLPRMLAKRRSIMRRRRATDSAVARWFGGTADQPMGPMDELK